MLFTNRELKKIIVPLFIEQLLAVTIGMIDTVMVASAGDAAVSGVSLVDSVNLLMAYVIGALASGGAITISQLLGAKNREYAICRHGNLYWHDLRYLCDCVADTGAKAAIWYDAAFVNPEEYRKHFDIDEVLLCPWYYWSLKPENFTKMEDFPWPGQFDHLNLRVIEDLPRLKNFREQGIDFCKAGQSYLPTSWPSRRARAARARFSSVGERSSVSIYSSSPKAFSFSACSASRRASMISSISPSRMLSI